MWRSIKLAFAGSIVALSLGMTVASSYAQDEVRDVPAARTTTTNDDNVGFDLGWLGLAGLLGLIGLMPKDRSIPHDQSVQR